MGDLRSILFAESAFKAGSSKSRELPVASHPSATSPVLHFACNTLNSASWLFLIPPTPSKLSECHLWDTSLVTVMNNSKQIFSSDQHCHSDSVTEQQATIFYGILWPWSGTQGIVSWFCCEIGMPLLRNFTTFLDLPFIRVVGSRESTCKKVYQKLLSLALSEKENAEETVRMPWKCPANLIRLSIQVSLKGGSVTWGEDLDVWSVTYSHGETLQLKIPNICSLAT